jgi:hypothetical protein
MITSAFKLPFRAQTRIHRFQSSLSESLVERVKHNKIPQKIASKIMHDLRLEQVKNPLAFPRMNPGDAVEVKMLPYKSAPNPVVMRGVVLSKVRWIGS